MAKKITQKKEKLDKKSNKLSQLSTEMETPLGFAELIVDGSLPPVKIKLKQTKQEKKPASDDELLTELQCEV